MREKIKILKQKFPVIVASSYKQNIKISGTIIPQKTKVIDSDYQKNGFIIMSAVEIDIAIESSNKETTYTININYCGEYELPHMENDIFHHHHTIKDDEKTEAWDISIHEY